MALLSASGWPGGALELGWGQEEGKLGSVACVRTRGPSVSPTVARWCLADWRGERYWISPSPPLSRVEEKVNEKEGG